MASAETGTARVDASPFELPGEGHAAALCLHGLTGTPYEVDRKSTRLNSSH